MLMELRDETGIAIIEPAGRVDARTAEALRQKLRSLVESGRQWIVGDLSQVEFIDSAGLAALVSSLKLIRGRGGDLCLAGLQEPVRLVFEITRLYRTFDIYDDAGAAVDAIAATAGMETAHITTLRT